MHSRLFVLPLFVASLLMGEVGEGNVGLRGGLKLESSRHPDVGPSGRFSYASVVDEVQRSVVTVYSTRFVSGDVTSPGGSDFDLKKTTVRDGLPEALHGNGSGVIVTSSGYVLTNHHVIAEADRLRVHIPARGEDFPVRVIGSDPLTDIALLKIEAAGLSPVVCADSGLIRAGDVVLALGSPYGLEQTVTTGIVSATGRRMNFIRGGFEDFIQTDASINPGNSGGPLVDAAGRLIGINTARYSGEWGGASGIGFAVPVNLAVRVADDLLRYGHVRRGFLGVKMAPEKAGDGLPQAVVNNPGPARIVEIEAGGGAEKVGMKLDDVIDVFNGQRVSSVEKLRSSIAIMEPGTEVEVEIRRDGGKLTLRPVLGEAPEAPVLYRDKPAAASTPKVTELQLGLEVIPLTDALRYDHKIPSSINGMFVVKAVDGEGHALGTLEPGHVILGVNGQQPERPIEIASQYRKAAPGTLMLKVWKSDGEGFAAVKKPDSSTKKTTK